MTDAASGRLYLVAENGGNEKIVEANSQAQAISKVVGTRFTAKAATARDVARVYGDDIARKLAPTGPTGA